MKKVAVCDTQPVTVEGLRAVIARCPQLQFAGAAASLADGGRLLGAVSPDIFLLDRGLGAHVVSAYITKWRETNPLTAFIVWGHSISEAEALRLLHAGIQGVLRKSVDAETLRACLLSVAGGGSWVEESLFRDAAAPGRYPRSELTPREKQVLSLVERGLKNREIARELGIRPGTVKIHLKHIFEKTGIRGRYGLALTGIRDRGLTPPEATGNELRDSAW
jgi:DNA-binding NarL/FixJ family response regulator